MTDLKILIHVPLPETDTTATFGSFWRLANRGYPLAKVEPGRCDQQRNFALEHLKASEGTHLLNLDHDHFHPIDVVERIGKRAFDDSTRLVISGLMYSRHDRKPAATFLKDGKPEKFTQDMIDSGMIFEAFSMSAAVMLISREIVDKIVGPWFAYTYPFHKNGQLYHPGTDFFFCSLMREHGIKMWVDTSLISPHIVSDIIP